MTRLDLQKIPMFQTKAIEADAQTNNTLAYLYKILMWCYAGDYGKVPPEVAEANNRELAAGEGHILARYPEAYDFRDDIYIDIHFSEKNPGPESNYGMIMYVSEY